MKATNAIRIARSLKRHGVEVIFNQSNPVAITLAAKKEGINLIGFRQENTGMYMGHGYS
ncbi:MAG TPA: hypothetical protein GX717_00445, partial [Clostridiaceae bacterium]|nr:hypothetical protein [Clostridiaceae bacterium]